MCIRDRICCVASTVIVILTTLRPYDLRYEWPCHVERSETSSVPPRLTPQEPQPPPLSLLSAFAPLFPLEQAPPDALPAEPAPVERAARRPRARKVAAAVALAVSSGVAH